MYAFHQWLHKQISIWGETTVVVLFLVVVVLPIAALIFLYDWTFAFLFVGTMGLAFAAFVSARLPAPPQIEVIQHQEPEVPQYAFDAPAAVEKMMWSIVDAHKLSVPSGYVQDLIISAGTQIFDGVYDRQHLDATRVALLSALVAYMHELPRGQDDAPFSRSYAETVEVSAVIFRMINPFRDVAYPPPLLRTFQENAIRVTKEINFKGQGLAYPQDYTGKSNIQKAEAYLRGTPLLPLFQALVPYQPFTEQNRCAHHWCLGKTQRGKTTFLRHLIKHDLEQVAKGECSLVVIDSKTLVGHMRMLKIFSEELKDRLILIDSDNPFPLNPFRIEDKQRAKGMLLYMLGNMMEATERQGGALGFYLNAVLRSRDRSLQKILDYMRLDSKTMPPEIENFDQQTKDWFRTTRKKVHAATSSGIESRLAEFLDKFRDAPVMEMLTADAWSLDLYDQLDRGGKVVLVDTDIQRNGAEGANLLGRLVVALIEQLATKRMKAPGKPVWIYIDEAADYLKNDPTFIQIYTKAAEAKVGMTVAYQFLEQIENPTVEKALNNAAIQSQCIERGKVELTIEEKPQTLPVTKLEFKEEPKMLPGEYQAMIQTLREEYPFSIDKSRGDIQEPKEYK